MDGPGYWPLSMIPGGLTERKTQVLSLQPNAAYLRQDGGHKSTVVLNITVLFHLLFIHP
jgi:hypothetical protein